MAPTVAPKVAVAVAGGAPVASENLAGLLSDWLMLETPEERTFKFVLPADNQLSTQVVDETAQWLDTLDVGYTAVAGTIATVRRRQGSQNVAKEIADYAQEVIEVGGGESAIEALISALKAEKAEGYTPYLMLAWGDDEQGPDNETRELLEKAVDAGIKVLDLTQGLDDLSFKDDESEEEPADEAKDVTWTPVEEQQEMLPMEEELVSDKVDWPAEEAQATLPKLALAPAPREAPPMPDLATTLALAYQVLDFQDRQDAARDMLPTLPSALTRAVRHHLAIAVQAELDDASVDAEKAAEAAPKPVSEPAEESAKPKRGKPRDTASDVVTVLIHEGKKTARIRQGRGRFKSGEVSKDMPRAEYEELVAAGGYTVF